RLGRRDPRGDERQSLPLRRLPAHRGRDRGRRRPDAAGLMRPFAYARAASAREALAAVAPAAKSDAVRSDRGAQYLAGGTTLVDLMKLDVEGPARVVDINPLARDFGRIEARPDGLHLGALVRMADAADH